MKPLSMFYYISGNRKRSLTMIVTIILCVGTVYYSTLLAGSIFTTLKSKYLPDHHYSLVYSGNNQTLDPQVLEEIKQFEQVLDVVPYAREYTLYNSLISAEGIPVLHLKEKHIGHLMERLGLKIIDGRVPKSSNEIILHEKLVKDKGLKIGDVIGKEVKEKEQLSGKNELVGIIEGEAMMGFIYLPEDTNIQNRAMIFLNKPSEEVTTYIENLSELGYSNHTLKLSLDFFEKTSFFINIILTSVAILIALVVGITLANISYIHLHHRKKEFSIIYALGYSLHVIKRRIFKEQLITILIGSVGGIVLSIGLTSVLNVLVHEPRGQHMLLVYPDGLPFVFVIPISVLVINMITANRMLRKVDPIATLEGRD